MKRKFISVALFGALVVASTSVTTSCQDYDDDIANLQGEITTNATNLNELVNEKVNNLTQEVNTLKAQEATLETALATAKSDLSAVIDEAAQGTKDYADVQAAAARVAAIEAAEKSIESTRTVLEAGIADANASIEALNTEVSTQADQISALISADKDLQDAINIANGQIEATKDLVKKAQDAADAAQNTADENAAKIAEVAGSLQTVENGLKEQISLLDGKTDRAFADIAANKAAVEGQIATVNALINANKEAIAALNNKAGELEGKDAELLEKIADNSKDLLALSERLTALDAAVKENLVAAKAYTDAQTAALKAELGVDIEKVNAELVSAVIRLGEAEKNISTIQDAVKALQNKDTEFSQYIDYIDALKEETLPLLSQQVYTVINNVGELEGRVDKLEANLKSLTEKHGNEIIALQNLATDLDTRLGKVEITAEDAKQKIGKLTKDFEDYVVTNNKALDNLKREMTSHLDEAIKTSEKTLRDELTNATTGLDDKITALEGKFDDKLKEKCDKLQEQIENITGTEGTVGLIDSKINSTVGDLGDYENVVALIGDLSKLNTEDGKTKSVLEYIEATNKNLRDDITKANAELEKLKGFTSQLRSIVFKPEVYYQGIEAIGVYSFNYHALTLVNPEAKADVDQTNDEPIQIPNMEEISVVPAVKASYHMNPSNAYLDTDIEHFSYVVNTVKYTRAVGENDITVDSVKTAEGGMFDVYFSLKNAKISEISATDDSNVDVVAMRYNYKSDEGKDTVITSDYAALKQFKTTDFVISKVAARGVMSAPTDLVLATKAKDALNDQYPTLEINYKNTDEHALKEEGSEAEGKGLNLDKWITVRYKYAGANTYTTWGGQETINEKKFKLVYELIGYKSSETAQTSESEHASFSEENKSILKVHTVDGKVDNSSIKDRTPLLRVKLIDETNNQIAQVGYIRVKITGISETPLYVENIKAIVNGYTVLCGNETSAFVTGDGFVQACKWDEFETQILAELNLSKTEFESLYMLETSGEFAKQYNNEYRELVGIDAIGKIKNTTDGTEGHQTNVLMWNISNQEAYSEFDSDKTKGETCEVSTWVKFIPKNSIDTRRAVFVKLTWRPEKVNIEPKAAINNESKREKLWFKKDVYKEGGYDEVYLEPTTNTSDANASCDYNTLATKNNFMEDPVDIIKNGIKNEYSELANDVTVTYKFIQNASTKKSYKGASGTTYEVSVSDNGAEIYAKETGTNNSQRLANINSTDGMITLDVNDFVKDIINEYKKREDVKDALTFKVEVGPKTCEPVSDLIALANNTFDVKVIKPIFCTNGTVANMELHTNTMTQPLSLEFEDFNEDGPTKWATVYKKSFWKFYEVQSIVIDNREGKGIQTDYTGTWKPLDENDPNYKVEFTEPTGGILLKNMGSVTLTKLSTAGSASFNVKLHLKVAYKWGYLYPEVVFNVKGN